MKITLDEYKLMNEREYTIFIVKNKYTERINTLRKIENEKPLDFYLDINHKITDNIKEAKITNYNFYTLDDSVPPNLYSSKKRLSASDFRYIAKDNINDSVKNLLENELSLYEKDKIVKKNYKTNSDNYVAVRNPNEWYNCLDCDLIPIVWEFDNGRYTCCGCGKDEYNHFSIRAQSVGSCHKKDGHTANYNKDGDDLKKNWNHYVLTGKILFEADFDKDLW